ncbi:MAG: hypothetical protein IJ347_00175 [Faecalibacterium sp.]|nr:hypothetical protein [Faecalibacterium sp.]
MATSRFELMSESELLTAFEEYQRRRSGIYAEPGLFTDVVDQLEAQMPRDKARQLAGSQLLYTMAQKWYREQRPEGKLLEVDDDVWVIQYGEVKMGRVSRIIEQGQSGKDYVYWIQPYDEDLDDAYPETLLGTKFFLTELAANHFLQACQEHLTDAEGHPLN